MHIPSTARTACMALAGYRESLCRIRRAEPKPKPNPKPNMSENAVAKIAGRVRVGVPEAQRSRTCLPTTYL